MSESLTISFDEIPYDWRSPGNFMEVRPSYRNMDLADFPARALVIGQKLDAAQGLPETVYQITRPGEAASLFGAGSVAADMVEAFLAANRTTALSVIALADPEDATSAMGGWTLSGTITAAGTFAAYVAGKRAVVTLAATATPATAATSIVSAINAVADMPVVATATAATITLTAKHGGAVGGAPMMLRSGRRCPAAHMGRLLDGPFRWFGRAAEADGDLRRR